MEESGARQVHTPRTGTEQHNSLWPMMADAIERIRRPNQPGANSHLHNSQQQLPRPFTIHNCDARLLRWSPAVLRKKLTGPNQRPQQREWKRDPDCVVDKIELLQPPRSEFPQERDGSQQQPHVVIRQRPQNSECMDAYRVEQVHTAREENPNDRDHPAACVRPALFPELRLKRRDSLDYAREPEQQYDPQDVPEELMLIHDARHYEFQHQVSCRAPNRRDAYHNDCAYNDGD